MSTNATYLIRKAAKEARVILNDSMAHIQDIERNAKQHKMFNDTMEKAITDSYNSLNEVHEWLYAIEKC